MNTKEWGPSMWYALHTITFNYPITPTEEQKGHYELFFKSIGNVLPCSYCRTSYKTFYEMIPIKSYLSSREQLAFWLYLIHNLVNNKLGVAHNPTFKEVQQKYEKIRAKGK